MVRTVDGDLLKLEGKNKVLEIRTEIVENTAVMRLAGSVTADVETELMDEILAFISVGRNIQLDFAMLDHISNTAQMKLLDIQCNYVEKKNIEMEIVDVPAKLYALFRAVRLDTVLRIKRKEG